MDETLLRPYGRFPTKIKLYKSLFLSIMLCGGCKSRTLIADLTNRTQVFEAKKSSQILGLRQHQLFCRKTYASSLNISVHLQQPRAQRGKEKELGFS